MLNGVVKKTFFHLIKDCQTAQTSSFLTDFLGDDGVEHCTRRTVLYCQATRALLVYFQPRFCWLLWGFKPVMQIQWNERDGAALHGPGLRLMKLQSCGLLRQQNEAPSPSGLNTSMMIRLLRLQSMTRRANRAGFREISTQRGCSFNLACGHILF